MQNEGLIERSIQLIAALGFFSTAFFWVGGWWKVMFFIFSFLLLFFASIGFCPLYWFIGKKNKDK
jgi:hypothetical protein